MCRFLTEGNSLLNEPRTDEELMALVATGDSEAFDELYARHRRSGYQSIQDARIDSATRDDLVADSWLKVWRCRDRFVGGNWSGWFHCICHRTMLDYLNLCYVRNVSVGSIEVGSEECCPLIESEDSVERDEMSECIESVLGRLPAAQRAVLVGRYWDGLSSVEIAESQQIPVGTVKGRIRLGKDQLRLSLSELA